jgi:hypothetical protein
MEEQYGIGDYDDRKILLNDSLEALLRKRPPVDVEKLYRILNDAKCDLANWYEMENEVDDQRVVETERYVVETNFQFWAARLQRLQRLKDDTQTMSAEPIAKVLRLRVPRKKKKDAPSYRRSRSGPSIFDMLVAIQ